MLIGEIEEIDERFRKFNNVIYTKDYGTNVEQDLALIKSADIYVGSNSGPAIMSMFGDSPYLIFGYKVVHEKLEYGSQIPWANSLQKIFWQTETAKLLISEFTLIFESISKSESTVHS